MIPAEIIEKAIEGGYKKGIFENETGVDDILDLWGYESILLDASFWQSLGKAFGWNCICSGDMGGKHYGDCPHPDWKLKAHKLFNLLLTNGDTEKFWKDSLNKK